MEPLPGTVEEQLRTAAGWFAAWNVLQRRAVLDAMLQRAVPRPADPLADLFGSMSVGQAGAQQVDAAQYELQRAALLRWFDAWSDDQRNALLCHFEECDLHLVYEFYDRFRQLRWH